MHPQSDLPLPGFEHVMAPYEFLFGKGTSSEVFGKAVAAMLEERIKKLGSGQGCCLHRRACARGRRRHHSTQSLLEGSAADLWKNMMSC